MAATLTEVRKDGQATGYAARKGADFAHLCRLAVENPSLGQYISQRRPVDAKGLVLTSPNAALTAFPRGLAPQISTPYALYLALT